MLPRENSSVWLLCVLVLLSLFLSRFLFVLSFRTRRRNSFEIDIGEVLHEPTTGYYEDSSPINPLLATGASKGNVGHRLDSIPCVKAHRRNWEAKLHIAVTLSRSICTRYLSTHTRVYVWACVYARVTSVRGVSRYTYMRTGASLRTFSQPESRKRVFELRAWSRNSNFYGDRTPKGND